jgi:hypothetical protein
LVRSIPRNGADRKKVDFSSFSNQFFVGAGENLDENGVETVDPDAATFDLALLSSCNHTIITRDQCYDNFLRPY